MVPGGTPPSRMGSSDAIPVGILVFCVLCIENSSYSLNYIFLKSLWAIDKDICPDPTVANNQARKEKIDSDIVKLWAVFGIHYLYKYLPNY
jgi:hypothetical protein